MASGLSWRGRYRGELEVGRDAGCGGRARCLYHGPASSLTLSGGVSSVRDAWARLYRRQGGTGPASVSGGRTR